MDSRPIGVFDSGLGGLTAVRKLLEVLPGEDIVYLGDTGRVPYGGKSRETILRYAIDDTEFLMRRNVKSILIACGTVSSNALREVQEAAGAIPVTGIVELSARKAANSTRSGKIGVIATAATIRSGAFGNAVRRYLPDASVTEKACPLFVPLVEDGRIHPGEPLIELCAREYLAPMQEAGVDTLILGCTHYPLLLDVIRGIMGPDVTLVNPGEETALYISRELTARNMLSGRNDGGSQRYFITDNSEKFGSVASLFLGRDAGQFVTHTDITE